MNILTTALIFGSILAAAAGIAKKGNAADKMTIDVADLIYKGIYNWTLSFNVVLESTNPTNTKVEFDYLFLEVFTGGIKLAKIEQRRLINIKPLETTSYTLPIQISLKKIVLNYPFEIAQIVKNGKPKTLTIKGYIRSNNVSFPYEDTFEL